MNRRGRITIKRGKRSTMAPHQFGVVRRCLFDGVTISNPVTAIDAGLGRGFIAEDNHFSNIATGIATSSVPAIDLIIWNNTFDIVHYGVWLSYASTSPTFGRAVVLDNAFNLARDVASIGIQIVGTGTGQYFNQAVVRKNVIAADPLSTGSTSLLSGINIFNVVNAIVENNVISDCENSPGDPLEYQYCSTFKSFNNQNRSGTLLRAYDSVNSRYLMELQDFCEDALIGF